MGGRGHAAPVRGCFRHPDLRAVVGQDCRPHQTGNARPAASPAAGRPDAPSEHSSTSWLQAGPVYPEGQVQMALPFTGLVSQLEPSLQGLLMQASFKWQSRPGRDSGGQRGTRPSLGTAGPPRPRCPAAPSGPRRPGRSGRLVSSGPAPLRPRPSSLQPPQPRVQGTVRPGPCWHSPVRPWGHSQ